MKKVLYCKFANDRCEKFKIKTIIYEKNGIKKVEKKYINMQAKQHVLNIYDNYTLLNSIFDEKHAKIASAYLINDFVEIEYIEGITLTQKLNNLVLDNSIDDFFSTLHNYINILSFNQEVREFEISNDFINMFGNISFEIPLEAVKINNIDFVFDNIIVNKKLNIIDYEWIVDFYVPLKYIIYRAVKYYLMQLNQLNIFIHMDLWTFVGINESEKMIFEKMECNFYNYVNSGYVNLHDLNNLWNFNQARFDVQQIINENEILLEQKKYQVFYDTGDGFSENFSFKNYYEINYYGNTIIKIPINNEAIQTVRFDPSFENCMIHIDYIHSFYQGHTQEVNYISNANSELNNILIFLTNDPQIVFQNIDFQRCEYIEIKLKINYLPAGDLFNLKKILDTNNELSSKLKQNNEKYENEKNLFQDIINKQIVDNNKIVGLYEEEKEKMLQEIEKHKGELNKIYNSKVWKFIKILKKSKEN